MRPPPPAPAYVPEAPTYQPDFRGKPKPLPASPHKRILPQDDKPGIWAGDSPEDEAERDADLYEVTPRRRKDVNPEIEVDFPSADDSHLSKAIARKCTENMAAAYARAHYGYLFKYLTSHQQQCLFGRMYEHCAGNGRYFYDLIRSSGEFLDRDFDAAITATQRLATRMATENCKDVRESANLTALFTDVAVAYDALMAGG